MHMNDFSVKRLQRRGKGMDSWRTQEQERRVDAKKLVPCDQMAERNE